MSIVAGAAALCIAAVLAFVLGGSGRTTSAQPGAIQGSATVIVARRDLVETDIETGTLGYSEALNVYGRLAGTVTRLPRAGAVIDPGQVLYRVEGAGVYLFNGVQPTRRAFHAGISDGADVGQLNRDLRAMGYDPNDEIASGERFSEATRRAVERWQEAKGLPKTGEIEFGRIVFQPGARRIEKVYLSLGGSATLQSSSAPSTGASEAGAGSPAQTPGVALVTTSLHRVATVPLEASKQAEARVGEAVRVTLPSGKLVGGHIANVAVIASTPSSSGAGSAGSSSASTTSTVSVEVTFNRSLGNAALDQAPVSVAFAAQRQHGVLSIPVTALVATGSGGYAVEKVQGGRRTLVPVTPGLYGGGFVAIAGVPEGTTVTNASQ